MLAIMAVAITVLASGSKGNCAIVSRSGTRLLVDAGLSCHEILDRMRLCGDDPESIDAILITHEHTDHIGGLRVLARRLKIPVYITAQTYPPIRSSPAIMPETASSWSGWNISVRVAYFKLATLR